MKNSRLLALLAVLLAPAIATARVGGGDVTFEVKGAQKVTFSHDTHVADVGLGCTECHDRLFLTKGKSKHASMKEMQAGKSCGACHDGKKAFTVKKSCANCHKK